MRKNLATLVAVFGVLAWMGCGDDGGGGGDGDDGGISIDTDGGDNGGDDGGTMNGGDDAGNGGMDCTPMTVPAPDPDACGAADSDCIRSAGTQSELTECLNNASAECSGCINDELLSCATMMGCDTEWGCVVECAMENMCSTTACVQENCPTVFENLNTCIPRECATITDHCLTGGGASDGGVPDGGTTDAGTTDAGTADGGSG